MPLFLLIRQLAATDSCLFVGRCSDYILRDHPKKINIFITANHDERIKRLQSRHSITAEQAETMMEKTDKKRSDYYNYYTYKTWGMASSYDLCINTSQLGVEGTMDLIEDFIRRRFAL